MTRTDEQPPNTQLLEGQPVPRHIGIVTAVLAAWAVFYAIYDFDGNMLKSAGLILVGCQASILAVLGLGKKNLSRRLGLTVIGLSVLALALFITGFITD